MLLALTVVLCVALFVTPAFAEITVKDGGWEVTVSGGGSSFASKHKGYEVSASKPDVERGFQLAQQKANESSLGLSKSLDAVVKSGMLCAPRPRTCAPCTQPCAPVYQPVATPCVPCQPTPAACPAPNGGVWVTLQPLEWLNGNAFRAVVNNRRVVFVIPLSHRGSYRHQPAQLSGWIWYRADGTLMFRDYRTCADIPDPVD
ncbi:MAG: hypothetical protein PHU04_03240 [Candidatus Peribacteraceae bacterium]|nr:hypothetical protein [Candidatus Peribacteraceae bacterium]